MDSMLSRAEKSNVIRPSGGKTLAWVIEMGTRLCVSALALAWLGFGFQPIASAQEAAAEAPGEEAPDESAVEVEEIIITPQHVAHWELELSNLAQNCETLVSEGMMPDCQNLLNSFGERLPKTEHADVQKLREQLKVKRLLIEGRTQLPPLNREAPDEYYKALFKLYLTIPEAYFPYDEAMTSWQEWMLSDSGKTRFKKYQRVRLLARPADDDDKQLEALFYLHIQQRFVDYGYKLVDLTTTAPQGQRETLVKITLDGKHLNNVADAALGESHFELTGDITSIRYTGPGGQRLPPRTWKMVETSADIETAREASIQKLAPQVVDAVFYLTLKQMFPS